MKIYTEEQVKKAIESARENSFGSDFQRWLTKSEENIMKELTPIELPSDEEIKKYTPYPLGKGFYNPLYSNKWEEGAKWMRNKIQGGDK